jgi:hypothetical protein
VTERFPRSRGLIASAIDALEKSQWRFPRTKIEAAIQAAKVDEPMTGPQLASIRRELGLGAVAFGKRVLLSQGLPNTVSVWVRDMERGRRKISGAVEARARQALAAHRSGRRR